MIMRKHVLFCLAFQFIIQTDVELWSEYLDKQAAKKAKRDAKGKKKQSVDDLM